MTRDYVDELGRELVDGSGRAHTEACPAPACCGEALWLPAVRCDDEETTIYVKESAVCAGGGMVAGATIVHAGACWSVGATPVAEADLPPGAVTVGDDGFLCAADCADPACFPTPLCCIGGLAGVIENIVNGINIAALEDVNFGLRPRLEESFTIELDFELTGPGGKLLRFSRSGSLRAVWRKVTGDAGAIACQLDDSVSATGTISGSYRLLDPGAGYDSQGTWTEELAPGATLAFDGAVAGPMLTPVDITGETGSGQATMDIQWRGTSGGRDLGSDGLWPTADGPDAASLALTGFFGSGKTNQALFTLTGAPGGGFYPVASTAGTNSVSGGVVYSASRRSAQATLRVTVESAYGGLEPWTASTLSITATYTASVTPGEEGVCLTQPAGSEFLLATACNNPAQAFYLHADSVCISDGLSVAGRVILNPQDGQCYEVGSVVTPAEDLDGTFPVRFADAAAFTCLAGCADPACDFGVCCEALLDGSHQKIVDDVDFAAQALLRVGSAPILRERYFLSLESSEQGRGHDPQDNPEFNVFMDLEYTAAVDPASGTCDAETIAVLSDAASFWGVTRKLNAVTAGVPFAQAFRLRASALGRLLSGRFLPPVLDVLNTNAETDPFPVDMSQGYALNISWGSVTRGIWTIQAMTATPLLPRARRSGGVFGAHTFVAGGMNGPLDPWLANSGIRLSCTVLTDNPDPLNPGFVLGGAGAANLATNLALGRTGTATGWVRYGASGLVSTAEMSLSADLVTPNPFGTGFVDQVERVRLSLYHETRIQINGGCAPGALLVAGGGPPPSAARTPPPPVAGEGGGVLGRVLSRGGARRLAGFVKRPGG